MPPKAPHASSHNAKSCPALFINRLPCYNPVSGGAQRRPRPGLGQARPGLGTASSTKPLGLWLLNSPIPGLTLMAIEWTGLQIEPGGGDSEGLAAPSCCSTSLEHGPEGAVLLSLPAEVLLHILTSVPLADR